MELIPVEKFDYSYLIKLHMQNAHGGITPERLRIHMLMLFVRLILRQRALLR